MSGSALKIMVLAGGPDREREVSLISGQQVSAALENAGHLVRQRDITPDNLTALEEFVAWSGDVIFIALHGSWGEGGGLQSILDLRKLPYFGCQSAAADLCMDKYRTKRTLENAGLPTPAYEVIVPGGDVTLEAPLVLKPLREGSSIDIAICMTPDQAHTQARELLQRHDRLLVEQFVAGLELTCGVIGDPLTDRDMPLPPVMIQPATAFYDYQAKYLRDDTQYRFDIPLPVTTLALVQQLALRAHQVCGCRHLSRVDFLVDRENQPWILEINTIPGFTSHSLIPKAAAHVGIGFTQLCDRLARLALQG